MTRRVDCPWCPGERLDDPDHLKNVHRNLWEAARPSVDRCECGNRTYYSSRVCGRCRDQLRKRRARAGRLRQVRWPASKSVGGLDD